MPPGRNRIAAASLAFGRHIRRVPRHQDLVIADMDSDLASEEIGRPALALRHDPVLSGLERVRAGGCEGPRGAELLGRVDMVEAEAGGELQRPHASGTSPKNCRRSPSRRPSRAGRTP
jgi:hypothetical protein